MGKRNSHQEEPIKRGRLKKDNMPRTDAPYSAGIPPSYLKYNLESKNNNQRRAIQYLEEGRTVIFLTGSAGTGKSLIACSRGAKLLQTKQISKIYLARPAVAVGKSIGLLPGEIEEKLLPYFKQTLNHLEKFLGAGYLDYCVSKKIIEMVPVEYLRGVSLENCYTIVEEAQNFLPSEMEMVLTRIGDNCQIVFTGDTKQNDLKVESGLKETVNLINRMLQTHPGYLSRQDVELLDDSIGFVEFSPSDVVRHGLTRAFVKMYYNNS